LKEHKINLLVDVRSWPTSKVAHFKREIMERWLAQAGVKYIWLGEELGGYRAGGYERYMEADEFKRGLEKLLSLAKKGRLCICCMERNPKHCHRRFIARKVMEKGNEVIHILGAGKTYKAELLRSPSG
jgi:uncharacterized protein (DUF488 family)